VNREFIQYTEVPITFLGDLKYAGARAGFGSDSLLFASGLSPQNLQNLFELHPELLDDLLALAYISLCLITGQSLPGTANRKSVVIQQTADLSNDQYILTLVIATVAAPLYRL
jgi:hypothetical protein